MARKAKGYEILEKAQEELLKTNDIKKLRILQAVVFPLLYNMSIHDTATAIGRSPRWVSSARANYIANDGFLLELKKEKIRNNAYMSNAQEKEFLATFIEKSLESKILVVNEIHQALEEHLGHSVALATTYNLLHRHGWRKLSPNKRHILADVQAQEDWKKNFLNCLRQ